MITRDLRPDELPPLAPHASHIFFFRWVRPPEAWWPYSWRCKIADYLDWYLTVGIWERIDVYTGERPALDRAYETVEKLEQALIDWPDYDHMTFSVVRFVRSTLDGSSPSPSSADVASIIKFFDMRAKDGNGDARYKLYPLAA